MTRYTRSKSREDRGLAEPSEHPQSALGGVAVEGKELDVRRHCRRLSPEAESELVEALADCFVGFLKAQRSRTNVRQARDARVNCFDSDKEG